MGDIAGLAASIEQDGLLQPIGVTPDQMLIFGQRRLLAYQFLGRETIPARIIDVVSRIRAEHAENEHRENFKNSERVAIGLAIETELGKRQGQRTDLAGVELVDNYPQVETGQKTREIAAQKAGFGSEFTYRQAKTVVQQGAPELVAAMDSKTVAVSTAATLAELPVAEQVQLINANDQAAILNRAKEIRGERAKANAVVRQVRLNPA